DALDACARPPAGTVAPQIPSGLYRVYRKAGRALRSHRVLAVLRSLLLAAGAAVALYLWLRPDYPAQARALIAAGRPQEAAAYLQERLKDIADDAHAQLELGHAYAASRRYDDAL